MNTHRLANSTCPMADVVRRFARNEVTPDEQTLAEEHLNVCGDCRTLADGDRSYFDIDSALRSVSDRKESTPKDLTVPIRQLNEALTDYTILEQIGKGGMGVVYKARQIHLGRDVALKVLPSFYGIVRPQLLSQFKTEAGIAAQLKHSSIISVYDFGEVNGTLYYAMELIEGRTIAEFVRSVKKPKRMRQRPAAGRDASAPSSTGPSAPSCQSGHDGAAASIVEIGRSYFRLIAKWMADVADALAYAHSCNVIHGDIKPANLLVARDDRVMIADFGLAHRRAAVEDAGPTSTLGTLRYMSPEQVDRTRGMPDHRSDIYAVGATMYELLTLRPLVDAAHDPDALLDVLNRPPIPPRRIMAQVPRELEIICLKACEKSPDNRYQTAAELAEDLNRWLLDLPILAKRPPLVMRALKYVRRHRAATIGVGLVGIALSASAIIYRQAQESQRQAILAAKEARDNAMELGIATALQDFYFDRPDSALQNLRAVATAYPGNIDAALLEWVILDRSGADAKADVALKSALAIEHCPDWLERIRHPSAEAVRDESTAPLASLPARAIMYRALLERDARTAIELISTALEQSPDDILCNIVGGFLRHGAGQYEEMQHNADHIMLLRPNWAIGFGLRGMAVLSMGGYEDANLSLTRAILLQPNCAQWWLFRSRVNLRFARNDQAEHDATKAITIDPKLDMAYVQRANARFNLRDYVGATQDTSFLLNKQEHAWLLVFRSRIHAADGAIDQQLSDLKRAADLEPFNAETAELLGACHLMRYEYAAAIQEYTRAIKILGAHPMLELRRAFVAELAGDSAFATNEYRRLAMIDAPLADSAMLLLETGLDPTARSTTDAETQSARHHWTTRWHKQLSDYLRDPTFDMSRHSAKLTPIETTELKFYLARVDNRNSETTRALRLLDECIQLNQKDQIESEFARYLAAFLRNDGHRSN